MNRTITIKGTGKLSLKPDLTVVSLTLKNIDPIYDKAMAQAAEHLEQLRAALTAIGFAKDDLKTADFRVGTEYEGVRDPDGNYRQVFAGYCVRHQLKIEFDFDTHRLAQTLGAVAACIAEPELDIRFTVKDKDSVSAALLQSACRNAAAKAAILAEASGVTLGELLAIDYNWGELQLYSPTRYEMEDRCMLKATAAPAGMAITPDTIDVSDNVTFVWGIG